MRHLSFFIIALSLSISGAPTSAAQFGGGTILHIEDGSTHGCVDVSKNLVSMQLASVQVDKHQSWLQDLIKKKNTLGVKFDITLTGADDKSFNFPRAKLLNAPPGGGDLSILPMQVSLMSKYRLNDGPTRDYKTVGLDLYFITLEDKSDGFKIFTSLVNFSKTLPMPANPYTTGISYFGDFANKVVGDNLQNGANSNPNAAFSFDLASNPTEAQLCKYGYLREGVQAVMYDVTFQTEASVIKVADVDKYCFWFDVNSNQVRFQAKRGGCVATMPSTAIQLNNPLVAFVVSAVPVLQAPVSAADLALSLKPDGASKSLTDAQISTAVKPPAAEYLVGKISPGSVKDILNTFRQYSSPADLDLKRVAEHATNQDVAAAVALRRCAVAGIPVDQCN